VPWPADQQTSRNLSHALLIEGSPENEKPANSGQGAESQREMAPSKESLRINPVSAVTRFSRGTSYSPVRTLKMKRVEAREARFDESDLDGPPSELVAKPSQ
jgi:hypothetical protein